MGRKLDGLAVVVHVKEGWYEQLLSQFYYWVQLLDAIRAIVDVDNVLAR